MTLTPLHRRRHLGRPHARRGDAEEAQQPDLDRAGAGAQPRPEALPDAAQAQVAEPADAHPIERRGGLQHVAERLDDGVGLAVDVDAAVGERGEQLVEAGDRFPAVDARGGDLRPGQLVDEAGASARPGQIVVVEGDDDAVGGHVGVGLEVAVAEVDGVLERRQRVLGGFAGPAAMGERERSRMSRRTGDWAEIGTPRPEVWSTHGCVRFRFDGGPRHPAGR